MTQTAGLEQIQRQIMWNRLLSVVEEQAQVLIRTAFSTSVREAGDLSAGVFDLRGRMLAQAATGTPGHVNAMAGRGQVRLGSGAALSGKGRQTVPAGERLVLEMPGGGGLGDPKKRPAALVAQDPRDGFVSPEAAARDYGWSEPRA